MDDIQVCRLLVANSDMRLTGIVSLADTAKWNPTTARGQPQGEHRSRQIPSPGHWSSAVFWDTDTGATRQRLYRRSSPAGSQGRFGRASPAPQSGPGLRTIPGKRTFQRFFSLRSFSCGSSASCPSGDGLVTDGGSLAGKLCSKLRSSTLSISVGFSSCLVFSYRPSWKAFRKTRCSTVIVSSGCGVIGPYLERRPCGRSQDQARHQNEEDGPPHAPRPRLGRRHDLLRFIGPWISVIFRIRHDDPPAVATSSVTRTF